MKEATMGKLTEARLRTWMREGAPLKGKSDGEGLTFTLSRKGTASWIVRYRVSGKQREITLGNFPDMSLLAARAAARIIRVKIDQGIDVAAEKRKAKLEASCAGTFRQLAEDYMRRAAPALASSTARETQRYLDKDILPRIGNLGAGEVTGSDIVILVERIAGRSDSVARHAFEIVSVIFGHGVAKHFVKSNPCAGLKLSAILGQRPVRRERIKLSESELKELLPKLPSLGFVNARAIKILLATCVRKSELILAKREHVDLPSAIWTIPAENSKTGKGFVVPLAPTVVAWFSELMSIQSSAGWLLPGLMGTHINRSTLNVAIQRLEGLRRFSPHDLRSTARSYLTSQKIGVSIVVAERCLNHALGGLVAVYDQHDYMQERRRALELWANFLAELEAGRDSNIAALRAAA